MYLQSLAFTDCQFGGSRVYVGPNSSAQSFAVSITFTNNIFNRGTVSINRADTSLMTFDMRNNLFWGGTNILSCTTSSAQPWTVYDNSFYYLNSFSVTGAAITNDYNAYVGVVIPNTGSGPHSTTLPNGYTYGSPLGIWYEANANYADLGSRYATNAGLYHYTTQTSLVKELGTLVDIGFHFVASDNNGIPKDTDGDGIPDYLEDRNGNGNDSTHVDPGETDWRTSNTLGSGSNNLTVFTPLQ